MLGHTEQTRQTVGRKLNQRVRKEEKETLSSECKQSSSPAYDADGGGEERGKRDLEKYSLSLKSPRNWIPGSSREETIEEAVCGRNRTHRNFRASLKRVACTKNRISTRLRIPITNIGRAYSHARHLLATSLKS